MNRLGGPVDMSIYEQFRRECAQEITVQGSDSALAGATRDWLVRANARKYSYHFEWMGRPIIQYPQDMIAMQEILWQVRPDLVIETGIAHGGSLVFYASILELIGHGRVLGIDIDIRPHNRLAIEAHPMKRRIDMIQASSIDPVLVAQVASMAAAQRTLVVLDSNHTHRHVLAELQAYAPLVTVGSYCVVMDTVVEDLPASQSSGRPWGIGDNPKTAVREFLRTDDRFAVDTEIESKLLITVAPEGYLKRIR
jgi:cephalosporin hydroxylase